MALTIKSIHQIDIGKSKTNNWSIVNPLVSFSEGVFFIIARVENVDKQFMNPENWKISELTGGLVKGFCIEYNYSKQVASQGELYIITVDGGDFSENEEVIVEVNENFLKKKKEDQEPVRKTKVIVSGGD
jgi:hypothetical protein